MLANLRMTVQESLRYRGRSGHYSWLAHRLAGLGILAFLVLHVWDTANVYYWPELYSWSVDVFKVPFFGVGEILIFGAVIYHAFNGIRITILDFKPEWWHYQQKSAMIVLVLFLIVFVPSAIYLFMGIIESCGHPPVWGGQIMNDASCFSIPQFENYGIGQ